MIRSSRIGLLVLIGLFGVAPSTKAATCTPLQVDAAEAVMHGQRRLRPVVAARVDGAGASFIFDTGAASVVVFKAGAARLKLRLLPHQDGLAMRSYGQLVPVDLARAGEIDVAGQRLHPGQFMVVDSDFGPGIDGLLAPPEDLDLEIDLAHGAIRLFKPADCDGPRPVDWPADVAVSTVELEPGTRPIGRVEVDGVPLRALFDTGSPTSSMTAEAARRVGVVPDGAGVAAAGGAKGVGPTVLKSWSERVDRLTVGAETMRGLTLDVVQKPNASADMILGADFFVTHRVFISRREHRLYAIPVGPGGLAAQP